MSLGKLDTLYDHREFLLLVEKGELIHNIGKLSWVFVRKQGGDSTCMDFDHEPITGIIIDHVQKSSFTLNGNDRREIRSLCNHAKQSKTFSLLDARFKDWIKSIQIILPDPLNDRIYTLADFIDLQSQRLYPDQIRLLFSCDSRLTWLGARAHGESSGLEKQESILDKTCKQDPDNTWIESVFGAPKSKIGLTSIERLRKRVLCFFRLAISSDTIRNRGRLLRVWRRLDAGLGDTRRPANDVTLWDYNYSAACLLKPALATVLLDGWRHPDQLRWRLLRVNFDVLGLYAKAIKIADLLGYQYIVDKACERIKQLVEEEYPLGNEVYRDTTGIYFTFPDLALPAELEHEIRRCMEEVELELAPRIAVVAGDGSTAVDQLKGILGKARGKAREALAQPFANLNLSPCWQHQWEVVGEGRWEVCPVCRLRPMREGGDACKTCLKRRDSRIEAWQKAPYRTIWMDELADHNGRVALIVGKFGLDGWLSGDLVQTMLVRCKPDDTDLDKRFVPKNPSPARLRRVWETCRRFWTETVEGEILKEKHEYAKDTKRADLRRVRRLVVPDRKDGWKENVPYDGTVNGKPISLLWLKELGRFITVINLQLTGELEPGQAVTVGDPDDPRKKITFTVQAVEQPANGMEHYAPFLPLLASPDQFLALVPAADALEIAERIRCEYTKQFGKVQNRLPLFLGLVFFPRKTPLMAVMDAARRMLVAPLKKEQWTVECCRRDEKEPNQRVRLSQGGQRVTLEVPVKMGDGETDDIWYPYFFVERFADGTPDNREYRFQHNGRWLVRVNDLKEDDVVAVTPSRFAYLWLEHTAKRFEFDPAKHILYLDELPRLVEMWDTLKCKTKTPEMTDTKLQGIRSLFDAKWRLWRLDEEEADDIAERREAFRRLVQTTFDREHITGIDPKEVLSGRFRRCLELYLHILKERIKED